MPKVEIDEKGIRIDGRRIPIVSDEEAEKAIEEWFAEKLGLRFPWPDSVEVADKSLVWVEQRTLFDCTDDWGCPQPPTEMSQRLLEAGKRGMIRGLEPASAFSAFVTRASELGIPHG